LFWPGIWIAVTAPFDGLGLRGNYSSPVVAVGVLVEKAAMLGTDGAGFEVMMNIVLPYFQFMSAGCCLGLMEAATTKAAAHVGGTKLEHLGSSLADLPTIRAYVALCDQTDMVRRRCWMP
jgi:alkylation response protein AidB-like acyl-CoA dehydrogenase